MLPPEPRLQVSAPKDLKQYKAAQEEILNSYGWVDQKAGIVRIPIDRAMDILVQKGLPVRGATPAKQGVLKTSELKPKGYSDVRKVAQGPSGDGLRTRRA